MSILLDDLRRAPTPIQLASRSDLVHEVKAAHDALIRAALTAAKGDALPLEVRDDLRRYAIWLEDLAVDSERLDERDTQTALNLAATLSEFVGTLELESESISRSLFRPPLDDLMRSAIAGSLTAYQAQSTLVARRVKAHIQRLEPCSSVDRFHLAVASVVASLLGREFANAVREASDLFALGREAVATLRQERASSYDYLEVDRALALALATAQVATGMLAETPGLVETAIAHFEHVSEAARDGHDSQRYWLSRRLKLVAQDMLEASMHRVLSRSRVSPGFRRALARDGVFELWGPQLEAIGKGLLDPEAHRDFVVSVPTGAGKTLIAELAIVQELSESSSVWAVYVAPSRALVNQVSHGLRRRLADTGIRVRPVLAGAEQSELVDQEITSLTSAKSVTVTTPEKLDSYYRNARDLFDSCALVVFDEIHKVSDAGRGSLLESLVTRFSVAQPDTRLLLLSGVLSNPEELVAWLGEDRASAVVARRRPTRQVRGVAVRDTVHIGRTRESKKGRSRRVNFVGGLVIVHEEEDLRAPFAIQIPDLFEGHYTEREVRPTWFREDSSASRSTTNQHAVAVSAVLARTSDTTLVFVERPDWAESCCKSFPEGVFGDHASERDLLARFLSSELGAEHDLTELVKRGIAFHHAGLPGIVQGAIELALDRGWLQVVFATSTLREGLNTAATNVVLAGNSYWEEGRSRRVAMRASDFENLAGRAGRPYRETEGRVILIPDSMATANAVSAGKTYLLVGAEALRVRSQLSALASALDEAGGNMVEVPDSGQSLLLALYSAGIRDQDALGEFWSQTLWGVQNAHEEVPRLSRLCALAFKGAEESTGPERLEAAARTGLSLTSVETLRTVLMDSLPGFLANSVSPGEKSPDPLPALLAASLSVPELRRGRWLRREIDWRSHLAPLRSWIGGASYAEILRAAKESRVVDEGASLNEAVWYCADVSTWLSWGFGACYIILETALSNIDPQVGILPLLVRYGVSTRPAAYLSLLGVADRSAAEALASRFEATNRPVSLDEVSTWMSEVGSTLDEIFPERGIRNELLRRQGFGPVGGSLPYVFMDVTPSAEILPGQFVWLKASREGKVQVLDHSSNVVGFVDDPRSALDFARGDLSSLVSMILTPESVRGNTLQAAVMGSTPWNRD